MFDVASRNRKNTATESSETTLTARSGCFARTFAASNCTESEMAIRRAMSTNSATNASNPCSVGVSGLASDGAVCARRKQRPNSSIISLTVRGNAINTMESASTAATSSSSVIPASFAPSISSCPIPKETENARSLPKEPSAVCVSAMAPLDLCTDEFDLVHAASVEAARCEGYYLPARVEWQAAVNGGSPLVLRRLFVCARAVASQKRSGGPMRQMRYGKHGPKHEVYHNCAGTVFGVTLGNLMHHCSNKAHGCHATRVAMGHLRRVLAPAGHALATCTGEDVAYIARGFAAHRVVPALAQKLRELQRCRPLDRRWGHTHVVVGVAAAILTAFESISVKEADCEGLDEQLDACLRDTQVALVGWRLPAMFADTTLAAARDAEIRTVERARIGVARAEQVGGHLEPVQRMRLYLDCYRRAAWPAGEELGVKGHCAILKRIHSGELVDMERTAGVHAGATAPGVASLAALSALPPDTHSPHPACSARSVTSWPSSSNASTESMASSTVSSSSAGEESGGFHQFGLSSASMQQLAAAFSSRVAA